MRARRGMRVPPRVAGVLALLGLLVLASAGALLAGLHREVHVVRDTQLADGSETVSLRWGREVWVSVVESYAVGWRVVYSPIEIDGVMVIYVLDNSTGYEVVEKQGEKLELPRGAKPSSFTPIARDYTIIPREAEVVEKGLVRVAYTVLPGGDTLIIDYEVIFREITVRAEGSTGFSLKLRAFTMEGVEESPARECSETACVVEMSVYAKSYEVEVSSADTVVTIALSSTLLLSSIIMVAVLLYVRRRLWGTEQRLARAPTKNLKV